MILVLILVIVLGTVFYWYEWRPSQIISKCEKQAEDLAIMDLKNLSTLNLQNGINTNPEKGDDQYNNFINSRYERCLRESGLKNIAR